MKLADIVASTETRSGRVFDIFVLALVLLSVVSLSIETLPGLSDRARSVLEVSEAVVTVFFTVEYLLRISAAQKKLKYVFSFYGLIDLLAIIPFWLSLGMDLRGIRVFRLFRIFRILKLHRYTKAIDRFGKALAIAKEEAVLFLLVTGILLFISAVGIYYFENEAQPDSFQSIPHCLWWAVTTLTTVGYGDMYPITLGGRLFAFLVLMLGLGIIAVPAGLVASALTKVREDDQSGEKVTTKLE